MEKSEIACRAGQLLDQGFVILEPLADADVARARKCVIDHTNLLKNTRPNPASGHVAGFHRYPELEPLHALVSSHGPAIEIVKAATGCQTVRSIGLSDITVNRSQQWHVDLLRGKYQRHLTPETCWGADGGGVYKVLLYLQRGATLRLIAGAHTKAVPLDNDHHAEPASPEEMTNVEVPAGGIVLMDIRLPHRGSTEDELRNEEFRHNPKILVSTVLTGAGKPLGQSMERGNLERLLDWDAAHGDSPSPELGWTDLVQVAARS